VRYSGHEHPVLALAVSRDGTLVASGAADGAVDVWRLEGAQHLRTIYAHRGPVWALAFAPGGDRLLSSGSDGVVRLWDLTTGAEANGAVPPVAAAPEPQERGARLFRKCGMCHALTAEDGGKAGPTLHHLFGRRAGSVPGYPYSPALRDSGIVWTAEAVDRLFAEGPEVVAPGSKMPLQRMPDPRDRADLIEFLQRAGGD
jgi:cytochrome c